MAKAIRRERIVTHRALRPSDSRVIAKMTMGSRAMWLPYDADPSPNSLYDYIDDLVFQTDEGNGNWRPAVVLVRRRKLIVTTMDAFEQPTLENEQA